MPSITKSELLFLQEAESFFEQNIEMASYTNEDNSLIALRYSNEAMRDSIQVFQIKEVANFEGVLNSAPALVLKK